jgi:hypothetical protein
MNVNERITYIDRVLSQRCSMIEERLDKLEAMMAQQAKLNERVAESLSIIREVVHENVSRATESGDMHCAESSMRHAIDSLTKGNLQETKMQLEIAQEAIDRLARS